MHELQCIQKERPGQVDYPRVAYPGVDYLNYPLSTWKQGIPALVRQRNPLRIKDLRRTTQYSGEDNATSSMGESSFFLYRNTPSHFSSKTSGLLQAQIVVTSPLKVPQYLPTPTDPGEALEDQEVQEEGEVSRDGCHSRPEEELREEPLRG